MNTTPTYPQEVTAEDVPLLSADPELKAKGIANASLFEFQFSQRIHTNQSLLYTTRKSSRTPALLHSNWKHPFGGKAVIYFQSRMSKGKSIDLQRKD